MKATDRRWHLARGCFVTALSLFAAGRAAADDARGLASSGSADSFFGSYSQNVSIAVPGFHGIEPQLALQYNSSHGNGTPGVGWKLEGVPTIDRLGAGHGAARFDPTDIYVLDDGVDLVQCAPASVSPSCTAQVGGGVAYSTKYESYERIQFNLAANIWTVWSRTGVKSTYIPTVLTPSGAARWGLQSVVDTYGNTTLYSWSCDGYSCYPSAVDYNGTHVTIYREARPDPITRALGANTLEQTNARLTAITVDVSGQRARAYALNYITSGASSRSLLTSVQEFGTDSTLDATGHVNGGTSYPAVRFNYPGPGDGFRNAQPWATDLDGQLASRGTWVTGDFNGDGKTDYGHYYNDGGSFSADVYLANAASTGFTSQPWARAQGGYIGTWVTGDFNGDGMTDFAQYWNDGGSLSIDAHLSNGSSFGIVRWATQEGAYLPPNLSAAIVTGDFNGDGMTDFAQYWNDGGSLTIDVHPSTGSSFGIQRWATQEGGFLPPNQSAAIITGDFNGDGMTDFAQYWNDNSQLTFDAHLSTGSAFGIQRWATQQSGFLPPNYNAAFVTGDFNGDGKLDLAQYWNDGGSLSIDVHLSTGSSLIAQRWATQQYGFLPPLYDAAIITGDFNGDGRTDFAQYWNDGGRFTVDVHPSTGTAFSAARWATQAGAFFAPPTGIVTGDFNGDGMMDLSQFYIDPGEGGLYPGTEGFTANVYTSEVPAPDLINLVTGSLGGSTSVQYVPSSNWANTNNPPIQQTVLSVTSDNMMGLYQQIATTTYSYSGGLWDAVDRRFLGFHYGKRVQPCVIGETACPYDETWYAQSYGSFASPQYSHASNGSGALLSATVYEYTTNGATIPYTSLETGHWEYTYDGTGGTACPGTNCKRVYLTHQYDGYGNRTTDEYYGDFDLAGDETTSGLWYVYNPVAYVVSLPAGRNVFAGLGITGSSTLLQQTLFEYDGSSTWNAPPTRGSQTGVQSWVSSSNGFATTSATYDPYGNVLSQTNASAGVTLYAYDPAYHLYPTAITNPLQQTATFAYNGACGTATVAVDATGVASETTLDALCRPIATTTCAVAQVPCPAGSALATKSTAYVSYGAPLGQYNETDTPSADGNGPQWSRNYFDGNGRTYQTASKGPSGTIILTEMAFDNRGNLSGQSLPLYSQQPFSYGPFTWTTNQYDDLNRVVKTTYPDASFVTHTYGLWTQSVTSEMGRTQMTTFDAYGHSLSVTEGVGTTDATTTSYAYDLRGFLSKIVDAEGNTTTLSFDSLGRKTRMTDPDMGTLTYVSDGAGRLLSQTDAEGQVTAFGYDPLGRVVAKTVTSATRPTARYSYAYDEPRAGFHNLGAVTTIADPAGVQTNDYDALGELVHTTRTIDGVEYSLFTSFANGRVASTTYPDGDVVGPLTYDGAGRVASIPGIVNAAAYDASGNPVSWVNANGTVTARQYSSREMLAGIQTVSGGTTIQNVAYGRNADGTVASVASAAPGSSWNYGYGTLGRLTTATNTSVGSTGQWSQNFTYASTGRMTWNSEIGTYIYGGAGGILPHAVGIAGGIPYSYDPNGNMLSGNGRIYDFDSQNRLAQVTQSGTTWNYTYDARDNRIKTTNSTSTTIYLGKDIEATNGVFTKYISLGGSSRVAKRVGNGLGSATYWLHSDAKGSVEAVTNASGLQIASSAYYPYGSVLSSSVTSGAPVGFSESIGYAAERQDATGLIYLSARYYDPQLCRFVSADTDIPGVTSISLDRYAYSAGDPVDYHDPSGHGAIGDAWNIGAAFGGSLLSGAGTIFKGVVNAPVELVKTVYDAGGDVVDAAYIAATGNTLNFQHVSALGKATDTELFNTQVLNQYTGNTMDQRTVAAATTASFVPSIVANTFSFGTYGFGQSVYGYATGKSNAEQMQENAGGLVFQAGVAVGVGAYNAANAPEPVGFPGRAVTTTDPAPNVSSRITVSLPAPAEAPMVVDAAPQPGPGSRVLVTPNGGPLTDSIAPFVTDTGLASSEGASINATPGMSIPLPPPPSPFAPYFGLTIFDDLGAFQGFADTLGTVSTSAPGLPQILPDLPTNVFLGDPALGAPTGGASDGEDDEGE